MSYRIDFAVSGRTMRAKVCGRSRQADVIAQDIAEQARRAAVREVLIDVRGMVDRLGALGALVVTGCAGRRVAVVDSLENERYHPFPENEAKRRGYKLRYFCDPALALIWLGACAD
jgi:hypothetical protein